jgi:hypothetical protein
MLPYNVCYSGTVGGVNWQGKHVVDKKQFSSYLRGPVTKRMKDVEGADRLEADLRALATTGMAIDTLRQLLLASQAEREPWEVGEALAECVLEDELGAKWPWNMERDKRTPRANLPGADLIGFIGTNDGTLLLMGEVKTSSDCATPPCVLRGRSGMIHQVDKLCVNLQVHHCVIKWLYHRCRNNELWPLFQESVRKYLMTNGRALSLFGLLMRDTKPSDLDVQGRADELAKNVQEPTSVQLHVWYLPYPTNEWWSIVKENVA